MQYRPGEPLPESLPELRSYIAAELERLAYALEVLESRLVVMANHSQVADLPPKVTGGELARVSDELFVFDKGTNSWRKL